MGSNGLRPVACCVRSVWAMKTSPPQVAIASSWNEIRVQPVAGATGDVGQGGRPCRRWLPTGIRTISVSDGISMGHEGMHLLVSREIIADSVEAVVGAKGSTVRSPRRLR